MTNLDAALSSLEHDLKNEEPTMPDYNQTSAFQNARQLSTIGGPVSASPFDRLSDAVSQLMSASGEVSRIADRIAGPVPEVGSASQLKESDYGGLIDGMEKSTADIFMIVERILSSVKRIDGRL